MPNRWNEQIADFEIDTLADPGAGNPALITLPLNARGELVTVQFLLTTNAVAGLRQPYIAYNDGANEVIIGVAPITQSITSTQTYIFGQKLQGAHVAATTFTTGVIVPRIFKRNSETYRIYVTNMDAGDTITDIYYYLRTWPTVS